jgi:MFS family permease
MPTPPPGDYAPAVTGDRSTTVDALPSRTRVIAACCISALPTITHVMTQSVFGGAATDIKTSLEATSLSMGVLAAAVGVGIMLVSPAAGALVDRFGVRRALTSATLGYGVCCAVLAMSGSVASSTASRVAMGLFAAFLYPAFIAVVARLVTPGNRQRAISGMQLAIGLAGILGSLAATPVLASDSWRVAIGAPMLTAVPLAIALWLALAMPQLRGRRATGGATPPLTLRQVLGRAEIRTACAVAMATGGIMIAMGGLLNATAARIVWKLPEESWGAANAAFYLGYALGGIVLVSLTRRFGRGRALRGALALLAVSLATFIYLPIEGVAPAACAATFCCGLGASAMSIAVTIAAQAVPAESAGMASGITISAMTMSGMAIQVGSMASTLVPGSTPLGRAQACGAAVIAVVVMGWRAARRVG